MADSLLIYIIISVILLVLFIISWIVFSRKKQARPARGREFMGEKERSKER